MLFWVLAALSLITYPVVKSLKVSNVNKRKLVHITGMLGDYLSLTSHNVAACSLRDSFPVGEAVTREFLVYLYFLVTYSIFCLYDDLSVYEVSPEKIQLTLQRLKN